MQKREGDEPPVVDDLGIHQHPSYNPQQNLSSRATKHQPEAKFAEQFVLAYRDKFVRIHSGTSKRKTLFVREVPVFGNGIPDLIALSWSENRVMQVSTCFDFEKLHPTVRAFEFKLSDWRRGLMQAHRYKYFSHASILVLPNHRIKSVEPQIGIFRKLRVGLWGFSPETGTFACLYTPRPVAQRIAKHGQKGIQLAAQAVCSEFRSGHKLSQAVQ
jgi:hypothetical protein